MLIKIFFALLALLSILFQKSRMVTYLFFIFMWILWGWNYSNGDYEMYEMKYSNSIDGVFEIAFNSIRYFAYYSKIPFQGFMIIYSFIVLAILLHCTLKSYKPALLSLLYSLVFVLEFVFIRNYLADSLLLLTIVYVVTYNGTREIKKILVSAIMLLLAGLVHNAALLYLIFLVAITKYFSIKATIAITSIIALYAYYFSQNISFGVGFELIEEKWDFYQHDNIALGVIILHLIVALPLIFVPLMLTKNEKKQTEELQGFISKFNILSLIYIPLYIQLPYLNRFMRPLLMIDVFFALWLIFLLNKWNIKKMSLYLYVIGSFIVAIFLIYTSTIEQTLYALLKFNLIL